MAEQKVVESLAYKDMNGAQKVFHVFKIVVCICTFGLVFPTVGD